MEMLDQINALQNELKSVVAEKTAMDQMLFQQLQNVLALKKENPGGVDPREAKSLRQSEPCRYSVLV